jgi:hypothetical protein
MRKISFVALAGLLVLGACKSLTDIPSSFPTGIVTLSTADAPSGVHRSSPTAYFVNAVNVSIPNSSLNADTCAQIPFPGSSGIAPLTQIAAGPQVTLATTLDTAQMLPAAADANGYIFYKLPANDSVRVAPGSTVHITVPGATNAFDAFDFSAVTADSLFVSPVEANPDSTHDLPITWNPQNGRASSFVLQLEFNTGTSGAPNSQIFCQFTDNGSRAVEARLANLWRHGSSKHVHAYRFLTTGASHSSFQQVILVSTYSTDSTHIAN